MPGDGDLEVTSYLVIDRKVNVLLIDTGYPSFPLKCAGKVSTAELPGQSCPGELDEAVLGTGSVGDDILQKPTPACVLVAEACNI